MSDLTAKFVALEEEIAAEHAEAQASRDQIVARLDEFSVTLDTLLANNAANTRYLLAAIGQNSPCAVCPTPPLVIPPVGTVGAPVDADKCKRVQAFLQFMGQVFTVLDLTSAVGIGYSPTLVSDAFGQVIASYSAPDEPDIISFPEAVQLVGDLISYAASNLLVGHTLSGIYNSLVGDLMSAMYLTGDGAGARSAYNSVVGGSSAAGYEQAVLRDAAYGAVYTYFFDPASTPDLSGFDGGICAGGLPDIATCTDFTTAVVARGGHNYHALILPPSYGPDSQFIAGDFYGWTWNVLDATFPDQMGMYYYDTGDVEHTGASETVGDDVLTIGVHTNSIGFFSVDFAEDTGPFTIRICPPAE